MSNTSLIYRTVGKNKILQINHAKFTAELSLYGAQLLSFKQTEKPPILWCSNSAVLDGTKAIRGGVPICWPWFGPSKDGKAPQHGYARITFWEIANLESNQDSVTILLHPAETIVGTELTLSVRVTLGNNAKIELITQNPTEVSHPITQAIHSYFSVDGIEHTQIPSLSDVEYIDKTQQSKMNTEHQLNVDREIDRVYLFSQPKLELIDSKRSFTISGTNHDSVVVWNPWVEKAQSMADFDSTGYKNMLCIEMANTSPIEIPPSFEFVLSQTFG